MTSRRTPQSYRSALDPPRIFDIELDRLAGKGCGCHLRKTASAEEFLSSRQVPRTSCLIADVHMPGMTGLELHRHLMASGKTIPTILITAYPDDSVRERALGDGVVCYLTKPFEENDLLACIRSSVNM